MEVASYPVNPDHTYASQRPRPPHTLRIPPPLAWVPRPAGAGVAAQRGAHFPPTGRTHARPLLPPCAVRRPRPGDLPFGTPGRRTAPARHSPDALPDGARAR